MFIRERVQLALFELPLNFGSFLLIDLGVGHVGQRRRVRGRRDVVGVVILESGGHAFTFGAAGERLVVGVHRGATMLPAVAGALFPDVLISCRCHNASCFRWVSQQTSPGEVEPTQPTLLAEAWRIYLSAYRGSVKLPGLLGVARHCAVRSGLACDRARRTPSASRSVVYTGVPGCWRQDSSRVPASTGSNPSSSISCMTTALAASSSPATGRAIRPGAPAGRPLSRRCWA